MIKGWITALILIGISLPGYACQNEQFCVDNRISHVYSAIASNVSIGITIESKGKTIFPESGKPMHLKWGRPWCRDVNPKEQLVISFKELVRWWAVTQDMNTYQQLSAGIRYLDIRPRKINGQLVTVHELVGASISDIVIDIKRFLNENPKEVVIFHIHEPFGMTQDDVDELFQTLYDNFGSSITPPQIPASASIRQFQNSGYQIIVSSQKLLATPHDS